MSKNFRAVQDGFYDGRLVLKEATFTAHDDFKPNWAVEVEDHDANADNSGSQEAIAQSIAPVIPELQSSAPLAEFHPAVAVPAAKASETDDALKASDDGTKQEVIRTADTVTTSDPAKAGASRKRPQPEAKPKDEDKVEFAGTGTEPSPAEKVEAKEASAAEVEEQAAIDDADGKGLI